MNQEGPGPYPALGHVAHRLRGNRLLHAGVWSAQHKLPAACKQAFAHWTIFSHDLEHICDPTKAVNKILFSFKQVHMRKALLPPYINIQPELQWTAGDVVIRWLSAYKV